MAEGGAYEPVRMSLEAVGEQEFHRGDLLPSSRSQGVYWRVCSLEFIGAFGDRMWLFAIPILFEEIWPGTLLPVAVYNFVLYLLLIIIMPLGGTLIDRQPRMKLMTMAIIIDNIFVSLASALTLMTSFYIGNDDVLWFLLAAVILCSVVAQFFADVGTNALEKDWIPVIAGSNSEYLTSLNSALRRVDLICKFIAPMAFGILLQKLTFSRPRRIQIGSSVVLGWNLLSLFPELSLAYSIHSSSKSLKTRGREGKLSRERSDNSETIETEDPYNGGLREPLYETTGTNGSSNSTAGTTGISRERKGEDKGKLPKAAGSRCLGLGKDCPGLGGLLDGWDVWRKSEVWGISLGYALLYGTILSPGPLLTAYLKTIGIPEGVVGTSLGLGAVFGLLGTVIFPPLKKSTSLPSLGIMTIWLWCLFLAPTAVIFILTERLSLNLGSQKQLGYVILGCVTVGRIWLWAFDLAETQILQEWVSENKRGRVAGSQSALCTLFTLCVYGLSVVWSKPEDFSLLVFVSFGFVVCGSLVTSGWYCCVGPYPSKDIDYLKLDVQFFELHKSKDALSVGLDHADDDSDDLEDI
eukprot:CAMPEP_0184498906 /NCGR_PEP_ID=MMETSP0113_2-20130426/40167_1 /TAXON_ID=91329 /ORGANISM="Norrisiella sphaerica, Strain BC52" /LENGTH=578 /DNA_ID=CAMNT_0026886623 /DNA_START=248 /DNA_END=1984 /DNA_ORIENTATION=+